MLNTPSLHRFFPNLSKSCLFSPYRNFVNDFEFVTKSKRSFVVRLELRCDRRTDIRSLGKCHVQSNKVFEVISRLLFLVDKISST